MARLSWPGYRYNKQRVNSKTLASPANGARVTSTSNSLIFKATLEPHELVIFLYIFESPLNCFRSVSRPLGREEHHYQGVGILLNKEARRALIGWKPVNERIITAKTLYQTRQGHRCASLCTNRCRHGGSERPIQRRATITTPSYNIKLLIGDFNATLMTTEEAYTQQWGHLELPTRRMTTTAVHPSLLFQRRRPQLEIPNPGDATVLYSKLSYGLQQVHNTSKQWSRHI